MSFLRALLAAHLRACALDGTGIAVATFAAACLLTACNGRPGQLSPPPAEATILRIGFPQVTGEDPLRGMQQASALLSFEALTRGSKDGRPRPWLAESWSVSADGLSWSLKLRPHAMFHDGTPVDAPAVKRSLDESLTNLADRSFQPGLQDIVSIDIVAPREIAVRLQDRSTFVLDDLSMSITKALPNGSRLGTGPFFATSTSPEQITMSSFHSYYQGVPQVERVVWRPYPALRTAWAGLMRGEVDFLYEVGQDSVEFVQRESSVGTYVFLKAYVFGVVLNSHRDSLKDQRVRQALNFAVDRKLIVDQALRGSGLVASTPIWPLHWAYDQNVVGFTYDPGRASAILNSVQSPRTNPRRGVSTSPAHLRFTCLLPENFSGWERIALLVQKQLFDVGVDMQLEALPAGAFNQRIARGEFDAVFLEMIGGYSMSRPYFFWYSKSPVNYFKYAVPAVDQALDDIRHAPDDQAYKTAVRELQESMIANPPAIFLAWGQTARAVSRRFVVPNDPDRDVFLRVSEWRLAVGSSQTRN